MTHPPKHKKAIKDIEFPIDDLTKELNKEKIGKRNPLRAHKYEDNSLQYHFHK